MKRVLAVIFAVPVVVVPGLAGAAEDVIPPLGPVVSQAEPVMEARAAAETGPAVPSGPAVPTALAVEAVPAVEADLALEPAAASPLAPVPPAAEAVPAAPVAVDSAGDDAYAARLHAELCLARPVFCEVDRSGRYRTAPAR